MTKRKQKVMKKKRTTSIELTTKELDALKDFLETFELLTLRDTGVRSISGGFATADMFDYDEEFIDIELQWGIQSDCQNLVNTEQYKLPRMALKLKDVEAIYQELQ